MLKVNLKTRTLSNYIFNFLVLISIFCFMKANIAYANIYNWIEVSKTPEGIQYIERNSLINKTKGDIEIITKYSRINPSKPEIIEENIYTMKINCLNNQYKDVSVNGKDNLNAKWKAPNGDKLIIDVISASCKNV